ncbi:hypothetical protein EIP91_000616 [Steccherinum ochraceum]|uniref:Uncharacterized protein n=1 Tax=Steccherinum ochraceum TaxID=92696 RepID=A0A4R0RW45_9APHY|nr:hypothetical protein EIP91_000616 [Steccherinum ochraceum]
MSMVDSSGHLAQETDASAQKVGLRTTIRSQRYNALSFACGRPHRDPLRLRDAVPGSPAQPGGRTQSSQSNPPSTSLPSLNQATLAMDAFTPVVAPVTTTTVEEVEIPTDFEGTGNGSPTSGCIVA